jgi:hypothetical protein
MASLVKLKPFCKVFGKMASPWLQLEAVLISRTKKAQPISFLLPSIFLNVSYHHVRTLLMFSAAI